MANCVSVMARMLHLYKFTISRHCRRAWKCDVMPAHKPQAVSDWLNLHSLGPSQPLIAL